MAKMKRKSKMGRPAKPAAQRRSRFLSIRLTRQERAQVEAAAKKQGLSMGDLLMSPWRKDKKT